MKSQWLVLEVAKTTGFGYTRILGELRKMGIKKISRQTVRNILKEEGIEPGPDRTSDSWTNFLERHKETLGGCDFFSVKTVTALGDPRSVLDVEYFNKQRAHSSRSNLPPLAEPPDEVATLRMDQIEAKSYVGGLMKSFERKAA